MALSNTAVPVFYGMFRDAVVHGKIPVNKEISQYMNIVDQRVQNPNYYYDIEAVLGFIEFSETEMTLVDGGDLHLLDSFKLWAEDLFGWYEFTERSVYVPSLDGNGGHYENRQTKHRLINKQFLIVGRGAAKSLYTTLVEAYGLVIDKETTHQIAVSRTMPLAQEILGPFKTALARSKGPLFKFMTQGSLQNTTGAKMNRPQLASTKKGIENFLTNSLLEIRPMAIDKLQSMRCKYACVDEWLSGDIREDVIGAIEQSASKLKDYVILATSSEGTVRNGSGDTIKMELSSILRGEYANPHVSIWWYKLDSLDEINNPAMWVKANPNIGVTVSYDAYQRDVEKAEKVPSSRNDILAKRFGIPMEGFTYYFTYEETLPQRKRDYWRMSCSVGADLSQGDDFCAFTFLFPLGNGAFGIKTRNYISEITMMQLPLAMKAKYQEFLDEGSLVVMPGTVLDVTAVFDDLDEWIQKKEYEVQCLGYDPYNAKEFVARWSQNYSPFGVEKVPQGSKTETVPLGEIKKLAEEKLLLFDEQVMSYAMGNCIVMEDTNGNRKLMKKRYEAKIDPVAAMLDALVAYKLNKDLFE